MVCNDNVNTGTRSAFTFATLLWSIMQKLTNLESRINMTRYPVPATRCPLPATRYPVSATRYPLPGTRYPVPSTRTRVFHHAHLIHILDDYLLAAPSFQQSFIDLQNFLSLCQYLGVPIAPEKTVGPQNLLVSN